MPTKYAGIGARKTPKHILSHMTASAKFLASREWVLRSGGAHGADTAFEKGAGDSKEIYLPWKGYNNHLSDLHEVCEDALLLASTTHPNWERCSEGVRKLLARNNYQLLGKTLDDPVEFVLCWTPEGKIVGGTGQALRVAKAYNIDVINFGDMEPAEVKEKVLGYL